MGFAVGGVVRVEVVPALHDGGPFAASIGGGEVEGLGGGDHRAREGVTNGEGARAEPCEVEGGVICGDGVGVEEGLDRGAEGFEGRGKANHVGGEGGVAKDPCVVDASLAVALAEDDFKAVFIDQRVEKRGDLLCRGVNEAGANFNNRAFVGLFGGGLEVDDHKRGVHGGIMGEGYIKDRARGGKRKEKKKGLFLTKVDATDLIKHVGVKVREFQ